MIIDRTSSEIIIRCCTEPVRVVRDARLSRLRVTTDPIGDTRTQQAEKDQTDINNIVGRYLRTGVVPSSRSEGVYEDVTGLQGDRPELIMKSREVVDRVNVYETDKKAKADAQAAADQAAGKAARLAQGAASKEAAPKAEDGGKAASGGAGAPSS